MKITTHKATDRGSADYGWLKPNYYFSFGPYTNRSKINFGLLRVLNDDFIAGGGAFGKHPHENMEIVTIPFTGALQHNDSTGGAGVIKAGDVQIMSAGSGVEHSEANASATDPVTLFQIWVYPKINDIEPRYDQRSFNIEDRKNKWQVVVSPLEEDNALWINQDARFSLTDLDKDQSLVYKNGFAGNGVFFVVIEGEAEIDGKLFSKRDAAAIEDADEFTIRATMDAHLLAIEIPMH